MSETMSIREARAGLSGILSKAEAGEATVITRNGTPVAALVSMSAYDALEEAADELLAREARRYLDEPTVSMAEVLADLFSEDSGQGTA
ncbi:type II toxin-antitoxin system Phd/YefM family antitoxin [Streptomyces sp. N50]|uniref:type II toxin-antitoxin system Phd/YefM family antitoxin n=1 Tax=Streptomyces sp. N50 TaxID=3081765 RepID=UPI0029623AD6|nr:type II toxin-antitoxin system Phd/YefM family antitoxin [Streptomyces sp. N50]WOX08973.1 type II toxin-antitoxin system Phd/YefM family antitoxin [Streptomyces sp. N50]